MAQTVLRNAEDAFLHLEDPEAGLYAQNHIYEPEFHQEEYAGVCRELSEQEGAMRILDHPALSIDVHRGTQPKYADDELDPDSLSFVGMTRRDGSVVSEHDTTNVCAIKSISVRAGYVDLDVARSVTREFYESKAQRAGVQRDDVLINSTGDGTIGRVAVYNHDFPAVVDGHITILRFDDPNVAWYVGAYLMSDYGQRQIYRYINGSSGQVEIYPQDIARIWLKPATVEKIAEVAAQYRGACDKYHAFQQDIKRAMHSV